MRDTNEHQERFLFVSWRDESGSIHPIGLLRRRTGASGDSYAFSYLKGAEHLDGFEALPGLQDLHALHQSPTLFPVFSNRVMPRSRPDYDLLASRLDLSGDADPFEVLARTGGRRATDRIEVFAEPRLMGDERSCVVFFARGIRHVTGAADAVGQLRSGERLVLVDDTTNAHNPRAIVLRASDGQQIGWVPDYLVEHIHELRQLNHAEPVVEVEHVNDLSVAPHMRLLCRLSAPWPEGYRPFSGPEFQTLAPLR